MYNLDKQNIYTLLLSIVGVVFILSSGIYYNQPPTTISNTVHKSWSGDDIKVILEDFTGGKLIRHFDFFCDYSGFCFIESHYSKDMGSKLSSCCSVYRLSIGYKFCPKLG